MSTTIKRIWNWVSSVLVGIVVLLAIALVGYTGLQPLITAMMFAILGVWAYGESILEVKCLLNGGKIAFEKTALNWKLSLTNLCSMEQAAKGNVTEDAQGMTYEEYLFMLLCNIFPI